MIGDYGRDHTTVILLLLLLFLLLLQILPSKIIGRSLFISVVTVVPLALLAVFEDGVDGFFSYGVEEGIAWLMSLLIEKLLLRCRFVIKLLLILLESG